MIDQSLLFRVFNEIGIIAQLSQTRFEAAMPKGMTLAQFSVLNHFVRLGGPKSPLALARAFQLSKATISSTVSKLEAKGYVSVVEDPKDGRAKLVNITEQGREMRDFCIKSVTPDTNHIAGLTALPDLAALLPLLIEMREVLDKNRNIGR